MVRLLGPLELVLAGTSLELASRLERAILATLALQVGRGVTMDAIARCVWGDDPPPTWRNSVHVRMSHLRRRLDDAGARRDLLATAPNGYCLALSPDEVDAVRFEGLVVAGRSLLAAGDAVAASATLQEAFDLWRGDPLPEISSTPAGAGEATRLLELRELAREDHHDAALALGQHQSVIGLIEAGLVDQPLRERRWAQLILALYRAGRQADALRAYQRARVLLIDELGIEPGAELVDLEAAVIAQSTSLDLSTPVTVARVAPPASAPSPEGEDPPLDWAERHQEVPLAGRVEEVGRLGKVWRQVRSDRTAGVVVISGDRGTGKTRLAAELAVHAADDGALVLAGRCVPGVGVAALFEQTTTLGYPPPRADGSGPWASPIEYGAAIFARLGEEVTVRPVLIVLDDLHHVDPLTGHLLGGLVDRPLPVARPWPLLVVAIHRDGVELPKGLVDLYATLRRVRIHEELGVGPLTADAARHLLGERLICLDDPASRPAIDAVVAYTGGSPGALLEMARHLLRTGVVDERGRWAGAFDDLASMGVPDAVRVAMATRLGEAPTGVPSVLAAAAVLGTEFGLGPTAVAAGVDVDECLRLLEEASAARLIEEQAGAAGRYRFLTALERAAVLEQVSESRRSRIAERLAADS